MIEWNVTERGTKAARPVLKKRLNGYMSHSSDIKVGVTTDPESRWNRKHARDGWARMVVVYGAWSKPIAVDLERDLIDYSKRCNFRVTSANINPGGEGIPDKRERYWVYILTQRF